MAEKDEKTRLAIEAACCAVANVKPSNYPEPFFSRMEGREKRPLRRPVRPQELWRDSRP